MLKQSDRPTLTRQELAMRWAVHVDTLRNRQRDGDGPQPFRIGRQWRYRIEDVLRYERGAEQDREAQS